MTINGQDKQFGLKIEKDKITLIGINDVAEMSLDESNMIGQILLDQSNICRNISDANKCLTIDENEKDK